MNTCLSLQLLCLVLLVVVQTENAFSNRPIHHHKKHHNHLIKSWPIDKPRTYRTEFINLEVDHFSFSNKDAFKLRYLVNTDYWQPDKNPGPIFFYTGNEGDITVFSNNTGLMWDLAPEFGAMLIFAEHRYYGISKPYGVECCKDMRKLGYLTSEQALADFAQLIVDIKHRDKDAHLAPVITFGGSYGGMLSAWMRVKYPHLVEGAISASAPLRQFTGITPCDRFNLVTTRTYNTSGNPACPKVIRKSWDVMNELAKSASGLSTISHTLRLCQPVKSVDDVSALKDWLADMYISLAMVDYPYPTNFLAPLPAWPVKVACSHLTSTTPLAPTDLLLSLSKVVGVYYNSSGQAGACFNTSQSSTTSIGADLWGFQACTEMVMPMCNTNSSSDMFEPRPWNLSRFAETCRREWGVDVAPPEPYRVHTLYGAGDLRAASNIVFTNGLLDPWSSGGITQSLSATLPALLIRDGAHHLDLRAANPRDPVDVVRVRAQQRRYIRTWIKHYMRATSLNYITAT